MCLTGPLGHDCLQPELSSPPRFRIQGWWSDRYEQSPKFERTDILVSNIGLGQFQLPSETSQNWQSQFFFDFYTTTINLTYFKHYSSILSDSFSFWTICSIFKDFFDLEHFGKTQCLEVVCAFLWYSNTLKLNSTIRKISNFMKFITKIQDKNCQKLRSF